LCTWGFFNALFSSKPVSNDHIGLKGLPDCSLLNLDLENAFNTIPRWSFLVAELYKRHDRHPVVPLVEMGSSRDSNVYNFDPTQSSTYAALFSHARGVRQGDPLGPLLFDMALRSAFIRHGVKYPVLNIGERCRDSTAKHAFTDDGNYIIKTAFDPAVYRVATEELERACARVHPEKSLSVVLPNNAPALADAIRREIVPIVTGTRTLGAPLAMDFPMSDEPPASHNINYVYSWLYDSVVPQQTLFD
jgi:hypothetical protein